MIDSTVGLVSHLPLEIWPTDVATVSYINGNRNAKSKRKLMFLLIGSYKLTPKYIIHSIGKRTYSIRYSILFEPFANVTFEVFFILQPKFGRDPF